MPFSYQRAGQGGQSSKDDMLARSVTLQLGRASSRANGRQVGSHARTNAKEVVHMGIAVGEGRVWVAIIEEDGRT